MIVTGGKILLNGWQKLFVLVNKVFCEHNA